jgi:hypothetical protein
MTPVACGGDEGSSDRGATTTTAVERATWSEQLGAACDELNRDHDQLATADPSSRDDAVAYAEDVEAFAVDLVRVLDEAGVPSEDRAVADDLADLADRLAASAGDLADAANDGDVAAARDATEELRSVGEQINPLAEELDAPACGGF